MPVFVESFGKGHVDRLDRGIGKGRSQSSVQQQLMDASHNAGAFAALASESILETPNYLVGSSEISAIPSEFASVDMADTSVLATARPAEIRVSPDGSRLYTAGTDGILRVYDMRTGNILHSWQVGQRLGGMDISPDGSFIAVVDRALSTTYRVDTATGATTSYNYATSGHNGLLFDVAVLSDGTVLFSQDFNGSGWTALRVLNYGTGIYTSGPEVRQSSVLTRSATGLDVFIGEPNTSGGTIDIYRTGTGIIAVSGAGGFNWGIQAFSGTLAAQYIYNEGIHIYNQALQRQITLTSWNSGAVTDLAFSADSAWLYVLENVNNTIVKISTTNWIIAATIPIAADVGGWSGSLGNNGSRLILDPGQRYFSVVTDTGLVLVENPDAPDILGTGNVDTLDGALFADTILGLDGNDNLFGFAGNDHIEGGAGGDLLDGGIGADNMIGGTGDDIYIVDNIGDAVTELANAGFDTVRTTLSTYMLGTNLERLEYIGNGDANLTGNADANVINGGNGNDVLDGVVGVDSLFGGAGNDRLILGTGADGSSIDGGADVDTLVINATASSLGGLSGIEALEFAGGSGLTLTGAQARTGLATNTALSGTGSLIINMGAGDSPLYLQEFVTVGGSNVAITVNGTANNDVIKGVLGSINTINGGDGADSLRGGQRADILDGGNGNDKIEGGQGADILTGGAGADVFRYQSANASGVGAAADRITDFVTGQDKLGFALIDTDPVTPGDQGFAFIGTSAFAVNGTAQIRYSDSGGDILVQADINGDGVVDMEIILQGIAGQTLTGGDFVV